MERTSGPPRPWMDRIRPLFAILAVGAGYYLGGLIGLELRIPPSTPSVLWPPNSLLTSALILAPIRRWPWYLAACLPAHLITQLPMEWPVAMIVALFFTNCSEAVIAAAGVRYFSDAPGRIDTSRRLAVFVVAAVLVAPFVSTFADATVIALGRGEPYWLVWRNRLFSSVLGELTIVPAVTGILRSAPHWRRGLPSPRRCVEAVIAAAGLVLSGLRALRFTGVPTWMAMSRETPFALQLPFLLWIALRFGPPAPGVALLTSTVLTAWTTVHGAGPFHSLPVTSTVLAMQLTLIVVNASLLCLATLLEERRESQRVLGVRLGFEAFLSRLSGAFVQVPSDRMAPAFDEWLGRIGPFFNLQCLRLLEIQHDDLRVVAAWAASGFRSRPRVNIKEDYPWIVDRVLEQTTVVVHGVDQLPDIAATDRRSLEVDGYGAVLVLPLLAGDRVVGALAMGATVPREWSPELVANVRLVAEVLANALARKLTEDALRTSELTKSGIFESLPSGIAVIDRSGRIIDANETWLRLADESSEMPCGARRGDNVIRTPTSLAADVSTAVAETVAGIEAVLDGRRERFVYEYVSRRGRGPRWWVLVAVQMKGPDGGAVLTHTEITERRRAELDAQQSRRELAHVARLTTVGELAASIAHQLNQPLTGIMSNAQAGRRLLSKRPPDLTELHAILEEIVDDDRRASEVIERLREFLRRGDAEMATVEVSDVIRNVTNLLRGDAINRNVTLVLGCGDEPLWVRGDRVQLEQVILNVLMNAMEAIGDQTDVDRTVAIVCRGDEQRQVHIMVSDSGTGLQVGTEELVFEAFYTTKPHGMGMGLSIARSIVDAHGGTIRARNNPPHGTVVEITLPLVDMRESVSQA